ncbi:unnamed protein product [Sphagnum jensenii]|uniref:Uncharacterized protein n=1 Tax=Sphagnum jensenii TaxID=128206 RepID=A0ABP0XH32_9BRYO
MTNYFLSPLGSRRWLPSNVMGSGGTHSAMLTSLGQQLIGDEISAISAAAAAAHDQSVARKSYLNYYRHQGAVARDNNTSDFLVYHDPLAALARGKYASSNLPQTTVAAAATTTSSTSFSSSPPACCNNNSPPASSSVAVVVNDFAAGGESSPGDYLMRSVDSLVAATSPQSHDDAFLSFLKAHEDKLNAAADQESASVTVINNNSCSFFSDGAQGFDKLCGDHHHGGIPTCDSRVQQHPGLIQAPTAAAPAAHVVDDAGMTTAFQHAIMQEEPMKVVQLGAQKSLESSSSLAHNFLDSIEDAPSGMSLLWPHEEEEEQQQQCEEDEGLLRLLREAAGEAEGRGFFGDEVADVGDGQVRNMQQSSGQSLHSSSSRQYFPSTSSFHSRVAFPEAVAMGSPLPNQVLWLPRTGAKPSGAAEGLRRAHDDDTPAAAAAPPLEQPPKVQTLAASKQRGGGSSSPSSRSPGTSAETRRGSERHETLKWLGAAAAAGSSYRNPNAVVAGTLQTMKPLGGHDRNRHDELCATLGTSKPSAVQNKASNSSNPASTSSPPSSSSASLVAQSPFENQGSSHKPLNDPRATPQAENNQAQKRKRYSEINGLIELMSTEHKPYLEIAALDTTTTSNPVPSSRALHNMEDALKIAVSNTLARKRSRSAAAAAAAGPHANHQQQHDSKEYWQPSKKQEVMRKPISPSAGQHANHQQQHDSKDSRAYQSSNNQQVMRKPISPSATVHELECQSGVPESTPPAAELEGNSSRVPEQITPSAAELECHSRVPQEIITPAAAELECHSRVPQEITPPAAELECHSRVPEETSPAAAELECHSRMREITTPAAAEDSWISNESAVKVAMPQVVVVNVEDSMGVEYWENLLAAGFAGEHDDCTPCLNNDDDDDFANVELDTRPQSPLSDFTSGMAMLFDYL